MGVPLEFWNIFLIFFPIGKILGKIILFIQLKKLIPSHLKETIGKSYENYEICFPLEKNTNKELKGTKKLTIECKKFHPWFEV